MKQENRTIIALATMLAKQLDTSALDKERYYYKAQIDQAVAEANRLREMVDDLDAQNNGLRKLNREQADRIQEQADRIQEMQQSHQESLANRDEQITQLKREVDSLKDYVEELEGVTS